MLDDNDPVGDHLFSLKAILNFILVYKEHMSTR